jgi:uncharacterized membrane protein YraQ (UPF0718 family)
MIDIEKISIQPINKIIKYILMGLFIFAALRYVPENLLKPNENVVISILSIIIYIILDTVSPTVNIIIKSK